MSLSSILSQCFGMPNVLAIRHMAYLHGQNHGNARMWVQSAAAMHVGIGFGESRRGGCDACDARSVCWSVADAAFHRNCLTSCSPAPVHPPCRLRKFGTRHPPLRVACAPQRGLQVRVRRRQPTFAWHPSLLLPGARLQVPPFKGLATTRTPSSAFTFIN